MHTKQVAIKRGRFSVPDNVLVKHVLVAGAPTKFRMSKSKTNTVELRDVSHGTAEVQYEKLVPVAVAAYYPLVPCAQS